MSTKQPSRKNSKSSMSVGSALVLILVVVLVRWYGGDTPTATTGTQSSESSSATQAATPLSDQAEPIEEAGTEEVAANAPGEIIAGDDEAAETFDLAVATLPPVATDAPAPTETATPVAEGTVENAAAEAPPSRAPPTLRPTDTPRATDTPEPTATPRPKPTATPTQVQSVSGLPLIFYDQLPPEAHDTIALIDRNGPFPFYKDGATFQNRERILPRRSNDYYSEYTVITPGEDDRGARRIVAGAEGELYYTDDHYDSFREVVR